LAGSGKARQSRWLDAAALDQLLRVVKNIGARGVGGLMVNLEKSPFPGTSSG
jgi:hypothetical protein